MQKKTGKLLGELALKSYKLENGKFFINKEKYKSYVIVDDLIFIGGKVNCAYEIINVLNKKISELSVVELGKLNAWNKFPFKWCHK